MTSAWHRAALALLLAGAATAARGEEPFDPFLGTYVGRAQAVSDDGTQDEQVRDLDVLIRPSEGGFGIDSITVNHQGDRMAGEVSRRSSAMSFGESDIDGVYERAYERDVFATRSATDAVAGDPLQWARIEGDTLFVYSFVLDDDGAYELHTYRRTRNDAGLALEFVSELDGVPNRRVNGQLIRVEDVMDDINP